MRQEVIKFFADNGFLVSKMISRRPVKITPAQVKGGMERVYDMVKGGGEIPRHRLAWTAWREGEAIAEADFIKEENLEIDLENTIRNLRNTRIQLIGVLAFFAAVVAFNIWGGVMIETITPVLQQIGGGLTWNALVINP